MLICRKLRFAFYHVPKTGGVSIGTTLRPYVDHPGYRTRKTGEVSPFRTYHHNGLHTPVGVKVSGLRRCAFVRNPWHRALSIWRLYGGGAGIMKFWEKGVPKNPHATRSMLYFCDPSFDFIGRFENLVADFGRMCELIGIDTPVLLHENQNLPQGPVLGPDWRSFYDDESREYVGDRFAEDIAAFNYTFD